jgi:hypothetical protein
LIEKESTEELLTLVSNIFGKNILITSGSRDVSVVTSLIRILRSRLSERQASYMTLDKNEFIHNIKCEGVNGGDRISPGNHALSANHDGDPCELYGDDHFILRESLAARYSLRSS